MNGRLQGTLNFRRKRKKVSMKLEEKKINKEARPLHRLVSRNEQTI